MLVAVGVQGGTVAMANDTPAEHTRLAKTHQLAGIDPMVAVGFAPDRQISFRLG